MFVQLTEFFKNKRVLILGFGLEGRSTLEILKKIPCSVGIADINLMVTDDIKDYDLYSGEDYLGAIDNYEIIVKTPGIALLDKLSAEQKSKITSQTDLLLRFCRNRIIGVTGTKGKSTTSSLIRHILDFSGKKSLLVGNIGIPPLETVNGTEADTVIVCEMSCHQLEYVKASPDIAVLLNIYEEHLDHYVSFKAYKAAKENIFRFQNKDGLLIYNAELDIECNAERLTVDFADNSTADIRIDGGNLYTDGECIPLNQIRTKLCGRHNLLNIGVAAAVCMRLGISVSEFLDALPGFNGLPHRLESIGFLNGAEYIDDSISTMPLAAIAAIKSFPDTDTVIIGGMDRGISYDLLVDYINGASVANIIALPDTGHKIAPLINNGATKVYIVTDMENAVETAVMVTKKRCILSPAAASYGFYKNFEERGCHFRRLVESKRKN